MSRLSPLPRRAPFRLSAFSSLLLFACVSVTLAFAPSSQTSPSADEVAKRLQAHYATVQDFRAEFVQTYRGALLPQVTTERGEVLVKKPGRMRWKYTAPIKKELVADGRQFWDYRPEDRVVLVSDMPREDRASTALLFLAGRGDLTRDFKASLAGEQPAGEWHLTLVPRTPQADFTSLVVQIDRKTMSFRGLVKLDDEGGTWTYRFPKLQENVGLKDSQFAFTPPRGVEVISR